MLYWVLAAVTAAPASVAVMVALVVTAALAVSEGAGRMAVHNYAVRRTSS